MTCKLWRKGDLGTTGATIRVLAIPGPVQTEHSSSSDYDIYD